MQSLIVTENFPPGVGGSGRWFWEVYSRLPRDQYLIAAGDHVNAHAFDSLHDIECIRWPLTLDNWGISSIHSLKSYASLFWKLRCLINAKQIQAVHCGRGLPEGLLGLMAWKWLGVPYLCYVHGEELPTYHSSREYKLLSQQVYAQARRIIVNSKNTRSFVERFTGITDTVRVMHPGVDTSFFRPADASLQQREQYGWNGKKVLLTVGRLQARKGHDHVIQSLKEIREMVPDILYVIVGDGDERSRLEDLVDIENVRDCVQFFGMVDDETILACYQNCDLFILANREVDGDFEGFGMVLVEAQACGKPVLAGLSGGTAETMIPGKTGFVFDAGKPDNIAMNVIELFNDETKMMSMGKQSVAWVHDNFDWNVLVRQAEILFSEVTKSRARGKT